jgi:uncharacterized membrane protein HdeD (DUF308 family)
MPRTDFPSDIKSLFAGHWCGVVLRGTVAIIFSVLAFRWPGMALAALVLVCGYYALVENAD